jgi:tetratricopeptide (TPR) repeat protein
MSKFDAGFRTPGLFFFATLLALPCVHAATQQISAQAPVSDAAKQPAAAAPSAIQPTPASSTNQQATPSPSGGSTSQQADTQLQYIVASPPPTPEQIGDSMSVRQRYQAAIAAYNKVSPMTAVVWNKMGIAYQMMFDVKDAIRCYNTSLKLDPRNAQVINNLATVYDSQKQFSQAEKLYRKALKIDPQSALIHRNLGSNLMAQHKYKKGSESYRAALAIDPHIFNSHTGASVQNPASAQDRGALHYYMARGCVSAGNPECAIQNLRLALNEGFTNARKIATDQSFASIRELPGFQQLIASQTAQ